MTYEKHFSTLQLSTLHMTHDSSVERCDQGLVLVYLHLRHLSNLLSCNDPKTENWADFVLATVSFHHKESSVMFQLNAIVTEAPPADWHWQSCIVTIATPHSHQGLHFIFVHWHARSNLWGRYDQKTLQLDDLTVTVKWTFSVLSDLTVKPQTNQRMHCWPSR